jgi:DNA-binding beta-propeller fold protein YncE
LGVLVNSFVLNLDGVEGLSFLPNSNLLLTNSVSAANNGGLFECMTAGMAVGTGLNLTINPPSRDPDGVILHAGTGTLFVADDGDERIYEYDTSGNLLLEIDTNLINPGFSEPEGITVDPVTVNLLVVDTGQGTRRIYELTTAGALVDSVALGGDPEGVTIDFLTRLIYVAHDNTNTIGDVVIPEPSTWLLFGVGVFGLIGYRSLLRFKFVRNSFRLMRP